MKNAFHTRVGSPLPLGSSLTPQGVNFAIFSRNATAVSLVIAGDSEQAGWQEIAFNPAIHKTEIGRASCRERV